MTFVSTSSNDQPAASVDPTPMATDAPPARAAAPAAAPPTRAVRSPPPHHSPQHPTALGATEWNLLSSACSSWSLVAPLPTPLGEDHASTPFLMFPVHCARCLVLASIWWVCVCESVSLHRRVSSVCASARCMPTCVCVCVRVCVCVLYTYIHIFACQCACLSVGGCCDQHALSIDGFTATHTHTHTHTGSWISE
jgi:hypothetical protein